MCTMVQHGVGWGSCGTGLVLWDQRPCRLVQRVGLPELRGGDLLGCPQLGAKGLEG